MKYGITTLLMLALGFGMIYGLNAAVIVTGGGHLWMGLQP
jgi:hypothetical protein